MANLLENAALYGGGATDGAGRGPGRSARRPAHRPDLGGGPRTGRASRPSGPGCSSASTGASRRAGGARATGPGSGWPWWPSTSGSTVARSGPTRPTGGGARFTVELPVADEATWSRRRPQPSTLRGRPRRHRGAGGPGRRLGLRRGVGRGTQRHPQGPGPLPPPRQRRRPPPPAPRAPVATAAVTVYFVGRPPVPGPGHAGRARPAEPAHSPRGSPWRARQSHEHTAGVRTAISDAVRLQS